MKTEFEQVFSEDLPKSENIVFEPLIHKYKILQIIESTVFFGILLVVALSAYYFISALQTWMLYVFLTLWGFGFIYKIMVILLGFKHKGFAIRQSDIHYKTGWITRKITSVPIRRIQHITVNQGVFAKMMKIAKLEIYTAGEASEDMAIKGIHFEKAQQIKALLSDKIKTYE